MKRYFYRTIGAFCILLLGLAGSHIPPHTSRATVDTTSAGATATNKPNIILIVCDDAGYNAFGCNTTRTGCSSNSLTPNLDVLATQSIVMSNGYVSSPVCSPSRAGLLTGQCQNRFGYERNISNDLDGDDALVADQRLISHHLQDLGYTTGVIGKWHLGAVDGRNRPLDMGFDEFYGTLAGGRIYWGYGHNNNAEESIRRSIDGDEVIIETIWVTEGDSSLYDPANGRYLTDAFSEEAVDFVNSHAGGDNPFFLLLSYTAPHVPYQAKQEDLALFSHLVEPARTIAAQTYALDRGIGSIMDALQVNGIDDSTIVIFVNDNGGTADHDNCPLRGRKGHTWEGGIRVVYTIKVPGLSPKTMDEPVTTLDLAPTLVTAAGGDVSLLDLDGVDLMPYLGGSDTSDAHDVLHWRYQINWAVRKGEWKLTRPHGSEPVMLYNLVDDIGEMTDVKSQNPDIAAELLRELTYWEATLDKPHWGSYGADDRNRFDHFVYRQDLATAANWSNENIWREGGTTNYVTMLWEDAYANAILEFGVRNDADYTATNDMRRVTAETFMLNQIRLTGEFTGTMDRTGTINGQSVILVKNRSDQNPRVQLDAMSSGTSSEFVFQIENDIELLHDLDITGDGTQDFVIVGEIHDYYDPRSVFKYGTSSLTLTGYNRIGGNVVVNSGEVILQGMAAAIDGSASLEVGNGGIFTHAGGVVVTDVLNISGGGLFNFTGGQLETSSILGNFVIDGGTFSPGNSTAITTIIGNFTQNAGTTRVEVEGPIAGEEFDQIQITGDLFADAELQVVLTGDYRLQVGQALQIFTANNIEGIFHFDSPIDPYGNDIFEIHYYEEAIELVVINGVGTDVPGPRAVPVFTSLRQNVPNPFNPVTVIRFSIAEPGWVKLAVYDVLGKPVRTLVNGVRTPNEYEVTWDGKDDGDRYVASGVYFYMLDAPGYREIKKSVLLK